MLCQLEKNKLGGANDSTDDGSDSDSEDESDGDDEIVPSLESTDEEGEGFGEPSTAYTLRERRIIGKWMAQHSKTKWASMDGRERWEPVAKQVHNSGFFEDSRPDDGH